MCVDIKICSSAMLGLGKGDGVRRRGSGGGGGGGAWGRSLCVVGND